MPTFCVKISHNFEIKTIKNNSLHNPFCSVIVPCYNEESNILPLYAKLVEVFTVLNLTFEVIFINDGSKDNTVQEITALQSEHKNVILIDLSRNFGKELALTAGLDHANGQVVVPIDADMQDPPAVIIKMIEKWKEGFEVVYAVRTSRDGDGPIKRITAFVFYRLISALTNFHIPHDTGDFRLMDKKVVDALRLMPERNRFMKGIFSWVGFRQVAIEYERQPRLSGKTNWNYFKLANLAIEGVTSFSAAPLRISGYLGFAVSVISIVYAAYLVVRSILHGIDVPGYASTIVAILFLGGLQLLSLGILGEYIGKIYGETKQRPLYVIRELRK